jgi:arylsulfatase A-like enzyme
MVTGYDAAIAYTDSRIADVLDVLDGAGVLEDTIIIISADHGDAFGEHGIYSDHVCADECIHRIPMIIRWPGVSARGVHSQAFLYNVDLGPTLCDLLGLPVPPQWDGESFRDNIQGKNGLDRDYLVWDCGLYAVQRAVRTRTHLMIRTFDSYGYPFAPVELYNLGDDPFQTRNLAKVEPDRVKECSSLLTEWTQQQMMKPHWASDPISDVLHERSQ